MNNTIKSDSKVLVLLLRKRATYSKEILSELSLNYEVLVASNNIHKNIINNKLEITTYSSIIQYLFRTIFYLPFYLVYFSLTKLKNYDVLYMPFDGGWDIFFAALFRLFNKKVVFTVHDSVKHTGQDYKYGLQLVSFFTIRLSNYVIFLTQEQRNIAMENNPSLKQTSSVIPHGLIQLDHVKVVPPKSSNNILFFGHIVKYKGVEMLIDSCMELMDQIDSLTIAGEPHYDISIPKHPKISYKSYYLSEKELAEEINKSDIIVLPYLEATQSGVLSIGIYAQKPMICTNVGGFKEQINERECCLIEPDKALLQMALEGLIDNMDLRKKYFENLGKKKKKYTWDIIVSDIEEVINRIR